MGLCYKISVCAICLSLWGIFQLGVMGYAYARETVMLVDSVEPLPGEYNNFEEFLIMCEAHYKIVALNCFISAYIYVGVLTVSVVWMLLARFVDLWTMQKQLMDDDYYCADSPFKATLGKKEKKQKKDEKPKAKELKTHTS